MQIHFDLIVHSPGPHKHPGYWFKQKEEQEQNFSHFFPSDRQIQELGVHSPKL